MKIEIPAFEPMAKCNEHLRHGPISIDLGKDVVKVVRCKDCKHFRRNLENDAYSSCVCCGGMADPEETDFCSFGERKEAENK